MVSDKELKKEFLKKASKDPEKYYATKTLKEEGFIRKQCRYCGKFFWTTDPKRDFCDEPLCREKGGLEGYGFIKKSPTKEKMDYVEIWKKFSNLFMKKNYTPIKRYPVVARWRDDTDFVQASIYDFQPWVVSGEVDPPANPLVIPQFCVRFNDVENVGITGAHYTGFVMIGQHAFTPPQEYNQEEYFRDIYDWLRKGLGLKKEDIIFHEDSWAGGGNFGPSMEFFSKGLELGNQVYMQFARTENGYKELKRKVLDMGMGLERNAWFSNGSLTSYDIVFPKTIKYLLHNIGIKLDNEVEGLVLFSKNAYLFNIDEKNNNPWKLIEEKLGKANINNFLELKRFIEKLSSIYSIADHLRTLLIAIHDGALPSNVGGGYNLRMLLRRVLSLIEKNSLNIDIYKTVEKEVEDIRRLFPEIGEDLEHFHKIFEIEKKRYLTTKEKNLKIIKRTLSEGEINIDKFIKLYESYGINPIDIEKVGKEEGIDIKIPKEFYERIEKRKTKIKREKSVKEELVLDLPPTEVLYYEHYDYFKFKARVVKILGKKVLLNKTAFYPKSGGQDMDEGTINGIKVVNVYKSGKYIVHELEREPNFKEGEVIEGIIDEERRIKLTQHHTSAHILNGAARVVLGRHVWQAGAEKTVTKARLDITHYSAISKEEKKAIEKMANEIIENNLPVYKYILPRNIAEERFGMRIYQGGAVPGKNLRIVEIPDFDVEACGGTHLNTTGEAELIKILKTSRIQDGVIRIEFVAGLRAIEIMEKAEKEAKRIAELLKCEINQIPGRVEELFSKWKKARKGKLEKVGKALFESKETFDGDFLDILEEAARRIKTQPEHLEKTIKRFLKDIENK